MEAVNRPNAEIRLNVSFFQTEEENVNLIAPDDPRGIPSSNYDEFEFGDPEYEVLTEKMYEIYCYRFFCRISRSSVLTLMLLVTVCFAIALILVIVVCTFVSLSRSDSRESEALAFHGEESFGTINWLHYPVGELSLKKINYTNLAIAIRNSHN